METINKIKQMDKLFSTTDDDLDQTHILEIIKQESSYSETYTNQGDKE